MVDRKENFKQKGLNFGDQERSRMCRAKKQGERRKEIRAQNFSRLRSLADTTRSPIPGKSDAAISRNEKLLRWKREKELKKKRERNIVRPPFKVGIVHHRAYSPPPNNSVVPTCSHSHSNLRTRCQQQEAPARKITRATEKRLAAKAAAKITTKEETTSFAPPNYKFKAPTGLPNIPLFGRIKKGSIDASKWSWNLSDKPTISNSEPRNSSMCLRKKSNQNSLDAETCGIRKESILGETLLASTELADIKCISPIKDKEESSNSPVFSSADEINSCTSLPEDQNAISSGTNLITDSEIPLQLQEENPLNQTESNSLHKADEAPVIPVELEPQKMDTSSSEFAEKPLDNSMSIALFSPYVVTRRGKKEARKEQKSRRRFTHSPDEIPTKDTIMQSLNISVEEEKRTSQYFKYLLESETNRLNEQCEFWNKILIDDDPPEEAKAIVEQAIGQTKLLLRSKFKQFEGLVLQCEEGSGEHLVTCKDLQGFWDMMTMTVKNCENRFQQVEKLKACGWKEEDEMQTNQVKKARAKKGSQLKKSPVKNKPSNKKEPAKSSLRAMILAARQKKKELESSEEKPADEDVVKIWNKVVKESPAKITTSKRNSSATPQRMAPKERKMSFPLVAMAISQKCKTPEDVVAEPRVTFTTQYEVENEMEAEMDVDTDVEIVNVHVHMDDSISYINSKHTPGKSILKRIKVESNSEASDDSRIAKSTQKVNFSDKVQLNEVEIDEDEKIRKSLAAALSRIDSTEFDKECVSEVQIQAGKKLDFEDDSFDESSNDFLSGVCDERDTTVNISAIPNIIIIPSTPKSPRLINKDKMTSDLEKSSSENIDDEKEVTFTKNLRSRTIIGSLTPRTAKKLNMNNSGLAKRGKSPRAEKENSFRHENEEQSTGNLTQDGINTDSNRSLNISSKNTYKSPRLRAKSPRKTKQKIHASEELINNSEKQNKSFNLPKKTEMSRRKSPRQKERNKSFDQQEESESEEENANTVFKFAKMAVRGTSLLYELIKSPKSATKKTKEISKALEEMQVDFGAESVKPISPEKISRRISSRINKISNVSQEVNTSEEEDSIYEKKLQLDDSLAEKSFVQTKSRRQRGKNSKSANKTTEESMEMKNSAINFNTSYKINNVEIDNEKEDENSINENLTDSLEMENNSMKRNHSRKQHRNENILNENVSNRMDLRGLNTSLKKTEVSKPKPSRRNLRIPENTLEKENSTPENLKPKTLSRQYSINVLDSPKTSPKPSETPNKRMSIKRSRSCHMEECQMVFTSTPRIRRSKSSGLVKTPMGQQSANLLPLDAS